MITGGFGMVMDLERGTTRRWVMGSDGVKRWADTGKPVSEQRMCKCGMPWEPDMDQFGCWSCGAEKPVPNDLGNRLPATGAAKEGEEG